ncbi:MAG: hypothetical protein EXS64_17860 [Candidatus Latescibacteria bacterium]|nr:hypothetical protein [Candidatus Latescibacterota bacterium]
MNQVLMRIAMIFCAVAAFFCHSAQAAEVGRIEGLVTDARTGEPLLGVNVAVEGTRLGAVTDASGAYQVLNVQPGVYTLKVSLIGYEKASRRGVGVRAGEAVTAPISLQAEAVNVEGIEVVGRKLDQTVLKLPASLHETPRSISIISPARIREQNFTTLASTFNYVPGVFANSYDQGGYHFYSRGFRMAADDTRIDGFQGFAVDGGFTPSLFGVERVVALRGPSGLLYGASGSPGGMLNLVTKKPQETPARRLDLRLGPYGGSRVGNRATYGVDLDATGPMTRDGRVLYRALFSAEHTGHFTANVMDRNVYGNLSMTYKLDPKGRHTFTPMAQILHQWRPAGRARVVSPATSRTTNDGRSDIVTSDLSSHDVNLSGGGRQDDSFVGGFDLNLQPTNGLRLNGAYRYVAYDTNINQFTPDAATLRQNDPNDPKNWVVQRRQSKSVLERWNHGFDVNATYDFRPANRRWKNLSQFGINALSAGTDRSASSGNGPAQSPINLYTGQTTQTLNDANPTLTEAFLTSNFRWNTYLQNQTSLADDRWLLTMGLGYAQEDYGRDYSRTATLPPANLDKITATRKGRPTPNAALVFNPAKQISLYASYSTSYALPGGEYEDNTGATGVFDPETGVNYETGAKFDIPGKSASLTLSVFRAERTNALIQSAATDLNVRGNRYYTQADGQGILSRGVEVGATLAPKPNWNLAATGAYINAENRSLSDVVSNGSPADKTPTWSFSLQNRYDVTEGRLKGLGLSLGLVRQTERLSAIRTSVAPDPLVLPAFTRVDAGLFYRVNASVDFGMNVENLLNEQIFVGGSTGASIEIAAPRRATLRVGYRI